MTTEETSLIERVLSLILFQISDWGFKGTRCNFWWSRTLPSPETPWRLHQILVGARR
jgi:hypothetical protein